MFSDLIDERGLIGFMKKCLRVEVSFGLDGLFDKVGLIESFVKLYNLGLADTALLPDHVLEWL